MKKALIIIVSIIAVILIVAAILPSSVHVERSININAPIELVFDQVNDLEKNFNWSPWAEKDPEMEVTWGETTAGLGASYSWKGNDDVGSGTLTVVEVVENEKIINSLDFGEMGVGTGSWHFEELFVENEDGDLTSGAIVTWGMDSDLPWPIARFFGLMMDKWVGQDFEAGLANLKEICEALPVEPKIEVEVIDIMEITMLSVKDSASMDQIGPKMGEMYGEIVTFMQENDIEFRSSPLCAYHHWDPENGFTVMEAGIPILKGTEVEVSGNVTLSGLPACQAARAIHIGSYESLSKTHWAIDDWINKNGKEVVGIPWKVYVTDPGVEKDTSKWVTEVYYPVN